MAKITHLVKHRSVIDRRKARDISQEPEMVRLKELYREMPEEEKDRTLDHLKSSKEA